VDSDDGQAWFLEEDDAVLTNGAGLAHRPETETMLG
jgi:hypothetical protein